MKLLKPHRLQLKLWGRLSQVKYRHKEGLFLAEGFKVVEELLNSLWKVSSILVMEKKRAQWEDFLPTIPEGIDVFGLSEREWALLSQDKSPEGIMAVVFLPTHREIDALPVPDAGHILLLYQIGNPNNLGAIMRTAHWFGIGTILVSAGSADFTNPKVVRSSMGSLFHLKITADIDFFEALPKIKGHYYLVGSHIRKGTAPHACAQMTALLMGSESHGLPEELIRFTDEQWYIPGVGKADSLSLPQAAAIMMYECTRQV
ncbi:MAG: RNA methyltransferase [Syntrophaceae bacterium]